MKQTIEIEVPKGKVAVYKNGKIIFKDKKFDYTTIKTFEDALFFCQNNDINIRDEVFILNTVKKENYYNLLAKLKIIYKALTFNDDLDLVNGNYYYPWIRIANNKYNNSEYVKLGRIIFKDQIYNVLGGSANGGSIAGLSYFNSYSSVSVAASNVAMFGFNDLKKAKYLSKQFGKLLFEVIYKFQNINWQWMD